MLDKYVREKRVDILAKFLFNIDLTTKQQEIVKLIAYSENQRACINAMTRYGKSMCVAIGVALYIWTHEDKRIAIIAPQEDQASIIRNYIAELISSCPRLAELVDIGRDNTIDRLKKETSRKRWTFVNGCELRTVSAHGEANRLMGFGADVIICDEAALISRDAWAKIIRMLGDDPENAILIELANPWNIDNKYYEHYVSGRFRTIHVGYKDAIREGRTTEVFVNEMRQELTPIEFTVLYDSDFPAEAEDSLFRAEWINRASDREFESKGTKIISVDPADKGLDWTVIMWGYELNGHYKIVDVYSEPISDNMTVANKVIDWAKTKGADIINIDTIGIGVGIVSRVKEVLKGDKIQINACHFGEGPEQTNRHSGKLPTSAKKRFVNKKAEQYFRLRDIFEEDLIDIPEHHKLKTELMKMRWEKTLSEKIKILDPEEKSPDFADALVYFCWKDKRDVVFFMG